MVVASYLKNDVDCRQLACTGADMDILTECMASAPHSAPPSLLKLSPLSSLLMVGLKSNNFRTWRALLKKQSPCFTGRVTQRSLAVADRGVSASLPGSAPAAQR